MLVLYKEGGFYMDTDMNPIRKIKDWDIINNNTFLITYEPINLPWWEHFNRI